MGTLHTRPESAPRSDGSGGGHGDPQLVEHPGGHPRSWIASVLVSITRDGIVVAVAVAGALLAWFGTAAQADHMYVKHHPKAAGDRDIEGWRALGWFMRMTGGLLLRSVTRKTPTAEQREVGGLGLRLFGGTLAVAALVIGILWSS